MANKIKDLYSQLKVSIVGTRTQKTDAVLNQAVKDIISYKSNSGRNGYIDLVRTVLAKTTSSLEFGSGGGLYSQSNSGPAGFGQGMRLMRYKIYESISHNISYAYRALSVLVDNILAPDDITKISIDVKPKGYLTDEIVDNAKIKRVKQVIRKVRLEDHLPVIIRSTLMYGDFFCEIAPAKVALTSRSMISEGVLYQDYIQDQIKNGIKQQWIEKFVEDRKTKEIKLSIDYSSFVEATKTQSSTNTGIENLTLVLHKPSLIVKLQSALFPVCFGYLLFPEMTGLSVGSGALEDQPVNNICMSILKNLQQKIPQVAEFQDNKELRDIIKYMVRQTEPSRALEIRYIPPDRMTHFRCVSPKYYPYGESIFDASQYNAKVLIALETALAVQRLSRSTEKRKIAIEVGLPRDARKVIEKMKEEFRKRKVSLDSFGTIDTIPSMITTFEDVYIPQKDGKPYVDISTFNEGSVDVRSKTDELKFMRDSLTATWNIPPAFLGIEENLSNKCLSLSTKITLLSGKYVTLQELINEFETTGCITEKNTYSYDKETGKIVPGEIIWAGKTRKNTEVVKVTLDNGEYEIVTPDHHFMLRDGQYVEAQNLTEGDSLMPLYTRLTHIKTTRKRIPYQLVYHPGSDEWQETHRMVAIHENIVIDGDKLNVHHKDFNPLNNNPENLEGMTNGDHLNKHIQHKHFITTGRGKVIKENYIQEFCVVCNKKFTRHIQNNQITCLNSECLREIRRINGLKSFKKREHDCSKKILLICQFCNKKFTRRQNYIDNIKSGIITCGNKECYKKSFTITNNTPERKEIASKAGKRGGNISKHKLVAYNKKHGAPMKGRTKENYPEIFAKREETLRMNKMKGLNHKVVSVEFLNYTIDTGDITVKKYHNFSVSSGIIVSNSALSEENILFARAVITHQKYLSHQLTDLLKKVFDIIDPDNSLTLFDDNIEIHLPTPKSLQYEREARYMNELIGLIEGLERIGIPKEYSKKKYLANYDWNEIKKYDIDQKVEQSLDPNKKDDDPLSPGGGGFGGGF